MGAGESTKAQARSVRRRQGTGARRLVRIDAVEHDPKDQSGEVVLYQLSEQEPASGEWRNLCQPDPEGRRLGFPLAGSFTQDGRYLPPSGEAERSRLLITCTGGAEGKCVRLGYKPWGSTPDGSSLAPYYQACVRLIRADYCGDGQGHTRNGTAIDIFDKIGIVADGKVPEMTFEAAWAPAGAVCVRHTRLPDILDNAMLGKACPRLADQIGESCDETKPALLFNRSVAR
ncbi:ADYC domain-containing protein [Bradyrhizobium sp. Ec3.3]|uniref:ADYC domain-containing protein n=1 Tax=Bradyrhizobium sp. Ec3.3 TaxID=189753 RepID=UPI0012EB76C7|nr:ADYC domain-containing protein [Bradyrhizobium sp. Ec3.3]